MLLKVMPISFKFKNVNTFKTSLKNIFQRSFFMYNFVMKTLARFIQERREQVGLSVTGLARKSNISAEIIEEIESGKELFLPVTVRQNLAKGLKCLPEDIKKYEKDFSTDFVPLSVIDSLKELILNGAGGLKCPKCGADLITKVEKMYDLEDNLVFHPKAHCSKCVFQIH